MKTLLDFDIIFWDFDGVIINSDEIRRSAFENSLKEYKKEDVNSLISFHNQNGGLSRYVKFKYFFKEILNQKLTDNQLNKLLFTYSDFCMKHLGERKNLNSSALRFIKRYFKKKKFHIASGSDNFELNKLCNQLEISDFFISISGSPEPKEKIIQRVIKENGYSNDIICLIGDSINDYDAANYNEISFFGYNNHELQNFKNTQYIKNF